MSGAKIANMFHAFLFHHLCAVMEVVTPLGFLCPMFLNSLHTLISY